MAGHSRAVSAEIEATYREGAKDPDFATVLARVVADDDEAIAEAIEIDGRTRIMSGRPVDLKRYLDGVPSLATSELALDAAIDVTLRSRSRGPRPTPRAVQSLIADYPLLEHAISEAAVLAEAVVSTSGVGRIIRSAPERTLPADFGPLMADGLSRYRLTGLLGSGSSGEVYLAVDRQLSELDRPAYVAIKLIAGTGHNPRVRRLLAEEATKARRVLHSHVVRVLDRGVSEQDEDYIVYEHVPGGDLDSWFERRNWELRPKDAALMVAKIARGVQAAHSAGLVHCDLKPSNVLISEGGDPKVCDFGIAVREGDLSPEASNSGRPIGNIAFISPEQFRAEDGALSPPSDVYALGGILFYLLAHQYPNGDSIDRVSRTHALLGGRASAPSPRVFRKSISADLDAICRRAMAIRPVDRYSSAAAFADDLEAWSRDEPVRWTKPSPWKVTRLAARRRPAVAAALGVAVIAVLGGTAGAGYWASQARAVTAKNKGGKEALGAGIEFMEALNKYGRKSDVLPALCASEALFGTAVFGTNENRLRIWKLRTSIVRDLVNEETNAGRGSDTETLIWQSLLGLWLINADQLDEAETVLHDNLERWEARKAPGDHLPLQVRALSATIPARRIMAAAQGRALTDQERQQLLSLDPIFRAENEAFVGRAALSPMRKPVLSAMLEVYSSRMLKDYTIWKRAETAWKKFD